LEETQICVSVCSVGISGIFLGEISCGFHDHQMLEWKYVSAEMFTQSDVIGFWEVHRTTLAPRSEVELNAAVDRLSHAAML
jgi:hypothetical protein